MKIRKLLRGRCGMLAQGQILSTNLSLSDSDWLRSDVIFGLGDFLVILAGVGGMG